MKRLKVKDLAQITGGLSLTNLAVKGGGGAVFGPIILQDGWRHEKTIN